MRFYTSAAIGASHSQYYLKMDCLIWSRKRIAFGIASLDEYLQRKMELSALASNDWNYKT